MPLWFCKCGPDKGDEQILSHPRTHELVLLQTKEAQKRRKIVGLWAQGVALLVPKDLTAKHAGKPETARSDTPPVTSRSRRGSVIPIFGDSTSGQDPSQLKIGHIFALFDENADNLWDMAEVRVWWSACESLVLTLTQYEDICNAVGGDPAAGLQLPHICSWYGSRDKGVLEAHFASSLAVEEKKKRASGSQQSAGPQPIARRRASYTEEVRIQSGGQPHSPLSKADDLFIQTTAASVVETLQLEKVPQQNGCVITDPVEFNDLVAGLCMFPDLNPDRRRLIVLFMRGCQLATGRSRSKGNTSTRHLLCRIASFMPRGNAAQTPRTNKRGSKRATSSKRASMMSDNDYVLSDDPESAMGDAVGRDFSLSVMSHLSPFTASPPECTFDLPPGSHGKDKEEAPPAYNSLFTDAAMSPNHRSGNPHKLNLSGLAGTTEEPQKTAKHIPQSGTPGGVVSPAMTEPQSERELRTVSISVDEYDETFAREVLLWKPAVEQEEKPWKGDGMSRVAVLRADDSTDPNAAIKIQTMPLTDATFSAPENRYTWVLEQEMASPSPTPLENSPEDPPVGEVLKVSIRCRQAPRHYLSLCGEGAAFKRDASSLYVGSHPDPAKRAIFSMRAVGEAELAKYAEDSDFLQPSGCASTGRGSLPLDSARTSGVSNHVYLSTVRGGKQLFLSVQHYTAKDSVAEGDDMWLVAHEWKNESAVFNVVAPTACAPLARWVEAHPEGLPSPSMPGVVGGMRGPSVASSSTSSTSSMPLSEYVSPPRWHGANPLALQLNLSGDDENRAKAAECREENTNSPQTVPMERRVLETQRRGKKEPQVPPPPFPMLSGMAAAAEKPAESPAAAAGPLQGSTTETAINRAESNPAASPSLSPEAHPTSGVSPLVRGAVVTAPSPTAVGVGVMPAVPPTLDASQTQQAEEKQAEEEEEEVEESEALAPVPVEEKVVVVEGEKEEEGEGEEGKETEGGGSASSEVPSPASSQSPAVVPVRQEQREEKEVEEVEKDVEKKVEKEQEKVETVPKAPREQSSSPKGMKRLGSSSSSLIKGGTPREALRKASAASPTTKTGTMFNNAPGGIGTTRVIKKAPAKVPLGAKRSGSAGVAGLAATTSSLRSGSAPTAKTATTPLRKSTGNLASASEASPTKSATNAASPKKIATKSASTTSLRSNSATMSAVKVPLRRSTGSLPTSGGTSSVRTTTPTAAAVKAPVRKVIKKPAAKKETTKLKKLSSP